MGCVWSQPVILEVQPSPYPPAVRQVAIYSVEPQTVKVGQPVKIYAVARLTVPTPGSGECVEFVLAVNNKDNIVQKTTSVPGRGVMAVLGRITIIFSQPGTYTVWVGAKYIERC